MEQFGFVSARSEAQAAEAAARSRTAQIGASVRYVAGGTNLVDLMKLDVERPKQVVDINALELSRIEPLNGGLRIGALARNSDVANHATVKRDYAVLSEAILSGASPQIRNMASTAGNLLQRTRCPYFRDLAHKCNKREPGSGCDAMEGHNRMLAILGTSEHCIATNPSDQNVALMALEATVQIRRAGPGNGGERSVPIAEFYKLPGSTPHIETVLEPGDLITAVVLPAPAAGARSGYLKLRDRAAYEFALASAAVVLGVNGGKVTHVRVALGGVGTVPWRAREAEAVLMGKPVTPEQFVRAAEAALKDAKPRAGDGFSGNGFKVELAKRCIVHALTTVSAA